jgi:hypothetical protein
MDENRTKLNEYITARETTVREFLVKEGFPAKQEEVSSVEKLPFKVKNAYSVLAAADDLREVLERGDQYQSATKAISFARTIAVFNHENLKPRFRKQDSKNATDGRYSKQRDLYIQATETVKLHLDSNDNPEWMHTDYTHFLLNSDKFKSLNKQTLLNKIRDVFKERGLPIANFRAMHVKLIDSIKK